MGLIMTNECIYRRGGALLNSHESHSFSELIAYCKRMLEVIRGRDTPTVDRTDASGLILPVSRDICSANFEPSLNPCDYGSVSQSLEYLRRKLEEIRGRDETVKVRSVTAAHKHSSHSEFFSKEMGTLSPFDGSMDTCLESVQNHNSTSDFCVIKPDMIEEYARGKVWEEMGTDISSKMDESSVFCEQQFKAPDANEETDECDVVKLLTIEEIRSRGTDKDEDGVSSKIMLCEVDSESRKTRSNVLNLMGLTVAQKWDNDLNRGITKSMLDEKQMKTWIEREIEISRSGGGEPFMSVLVLDQSMQFLLFIPELEGGAHIRPSQATLIFNKQRIRSICLGKQSEFGTVLTPRPTHIIMVYDPGGVTEFLCIRNLRTNSFEPRGFATGVERLVRSPFLPTEHF